jgi:hypothetical protein
MLHFLPLLQSGGLQYSVEIQEENVGHDARFMRCLSSSVSV